MVNDRTEVWCKCIGCYGEMCWPKDSTHTLTTLACTEHYSTSCMWWRCYHIGLILVILDSIVLNWWWRGCMEDWTYWMSVSHQPLWWWIPRPSIYDQKVTLTIEPQLARLLLYWHGQQLFWFRYPACAQAELSLNPAYIHPLPFRRMCPFRKKCHGSSLGVESAT